MLEWEGGGGSRVRAMGVVEVRGGRVGGVEWGVGWGVGGMGAVGVRGGRVGWAGGGEGG